MQFITTTGEYPGTNRLEIVGDCGKIVLEEGKLKVWRLLEAEGDVRFSSSESMPLIPCTYEEFSSPSPDTAHCGILENFVSAILDGTPLIADGREGIRQLMLTNAAYLSAWKGEFVSLPFDEEEFNALHTKKRNSEEEKTLVEDVVSNEAHLSRWQVNWT
jgi:hypothetical protein